MVICRQEKLKREVMKVPATSTTADGIREYFDTIGKEGGIFTSREALELEIQKDFVVSSAAFAANVVAPGTRSKIGSFLAANLGWKRSAWQSLKQGTTAGLIREQLVGRSRLAGSMLRLVAMDKNIPKIRKIWATLKTQAGDLPEQRLLELLHDQVVIGNYGQLRNVSDSPIVLERLNQLYLKHQANLTEAGLSDLAKAEIQDLSIAMSKTFDELRFVAGKTGMDIDRLENGGYFPLQSTDEFSDVWRTQNERWMSGYKSIEETFQKQRKTGLPVAVGIDEIATLLQKQLLGRELDEPGQALLTKAQVDKAKESAKALVEKTKALEEESFAKLDVDIAKAEKANANTLKKELRKASTLQDVKIKGELSKAEVKLKAEGYEPSEVKSVITRERAKLELEKDDILAEITVKSQKDLKKKVDQLSRVRERELLKNVESARKAASADAIKVLEHEQAKIALMDLNSNPGELAVFLNERLTENQIKRLFDGGILQQMPALSDDLLDVYRGFDLGVRGLSDAIILDPEQAIKTYGEALAKQAEQQNLFKTAFDVGADAGWVKASINPEEAADYVRVGNSQKLAKWLGTKNSDIGEMFIHKDVADNIDTLLRLNTSPKELQMISTAWGMTTSFMKKSMLLGRNIGYMSGVFMQNVMSIFNATGSLTQLPFAVADYMRHIKQGWEFGSTDKVFKIGSDSFSTQELFREVQVRRGGATLDSLHDTQDVINQSSRSWKRQSAERSRHFNSVFGRKWSDPVVGTAKFAGDKFNQAYGALAFWNVSVDNMFRWAAVRELALSGKYDNLDELLLETDNYFAINADSGRLGNLTGQIYMPFAQFAVNAPGAALRHAISHPWRTANLMQLYASASQSDITEPELPEWLRTSGDYFATVYRDKESGSYGVIMPQNVDYILGSYEWFVDLARDLSGNTRGITNDIRKQRGQDGLFQKLVGDIIDKSYIGNAVIAAMGFDPRTRLEYDPEAPDDTLLGIPMKRSTRALLTKLAPILRAADQALPPSIVGQSPTRATDPNTGIYGEQDAGTPSIFGATPRQGGYRESRGGRIGAMISAITGLSVQEIDPQRNIINTYSDFERQLNDVKSARNRLNQQRVLNGADVEDKIAELDKVAVALLYYRNQVNQVAVERNLKPPQAVQWMKQFRDRAINMQMKDRTEIQLIQEYEQWLEE